MPEKASEADGTEPSAQPTLRWRSGFHWFAAEFLVVVSGVLVALLLNAWWRGHEAATLEQLTLERLHEESEKIVGYLEGQIELHERLNADHELAVLALDSNALDTFDLRRFRNGVFFAFTYPGVNPPRSVYDEVIETGQFANVTSVDVRSAISTYYGELDWIQSQLMFFRQTAQPGIEMTFTFPFDHVPGSDAADQIRVDPATLTKTPQVRHRLIAGLRNQLTFQHFRKTVLDNARAMCVTLAKELEAECAAADPIAKSDDQNK